MAAKTHIACACMCGLMLLAASATSAQDASPSELAPQQAEARDAFVAGQRAYDEGRFEDALKDFRRAYVLTQHVELLYNIATVADRLRYDQQALTAYEQYLAKRPDAKDQAQVQRRIQVLKASLARAQNTEKARNAAQREASSRRRASDDSASPWPFVLAGTGAAVAIGGGVLLLLAQSSKSSVEDAKPQSAWSDVKGDHDRVPVFSTTGAVMLGAGVAAGLAGLAWAILDGESSHDEKRPNVGVTLDSHSVTATMRGRF
ncbi:MAG: hypothetical protein H6714_03370 [Myxococcales bacterium]|nr:hypothetical protein [Myxococcales bacterium]